MFGAIGLNRVEYRGIDVATVFRDFDDYWSPFLGGQWPAPSYLIALDDGHRAQLRERVREGLPIRSDGSIELLARARAVKAEA